MNAEEMLKEHNLIQRMTKLLQNEDFWDMLELTGTKTERMKKEELIRKKKRDFVKKYHTDSEGKERVVKCVPDRKGVLVFKTRVDGKRDLTSRTEDGLYEKLYDYYVEKYGLPVEAVSHYSFGAVWKAAQEDYCERHLNKSKTCEDHEDAYNRFVTPELSEMDIRKIDAEFLEKYALKIVLNKKLRLSAYKSMKGVFNFTFKYALKKRSFYPDIKYNPVPLMDDKDVQELCEDTSAGKMLEDVILSDEQTVAVFSEADRRAAMVQFHGYYLYNFMLKAHNEIGCRPGELVALKWSDIKTDPSGIRYIHIHASQRDNRDGTFSYLYFTKNEKGRSKGGREWPVTKALDEILDELRTTQISLGITSEEGFIFCDRDGQWKKAKDYEKMLAKICRKLGIQSKGTYAFRHRVNNVLEQSGMTDATKGRAIGNSAATNRRFYCHPEAEYTKQAREAMERQNIRSTASDGV